MAGCRVYQWSPVLPPAAIDRLGSMVARAGGVLALDLENGLATPLASGSITADREQARARLVQFFNCHRPGGRRHCIRINQAGTADFEKDIAALSGIGSLVEWETVFLSKVESSSDIYAVRRNLLRSGIAYRRLCPIVESCAGLDGLQEILESCVQSDVEFVQYGHYDCSLDREDRPFARHNDRSFRETVTRVIRAVEKHGCGYLHAPYLNLVDTAGLTATVATLNRLCTGPFGVASLSISQTRTIAAANSGNEFISPHEYLAVVRCLQKTEQVHAG